MVFILVKAFGKNTLLVKAGIKVYTRSTVTFKESAPFSVFLKTNCNVAPLSCSAELAAHLALQFAEKFQEVKEAAKLAKDKSQDKAETSSNHSQVKRVRASDLSSPSSPSNRSHIQSLQRHN